jgi:hypothetical protein
LQPAVRQEIHRRGFVRHQDWIAKVVVEEVRGDPKVASAALISAGIGANRSAR